MDKNQKLEQLESLKNQYLVQMTRAFVKLDKNSPLEENQNKAIDFFMKNPKALLSYFSPTTFSFINDIFDKTKDDKINIALDEGYSEDFLILIRMGIILFEDSFYLNPIFKLCVKNMLASIEKQDIAYINLINVIKGLIDINGYLGYEELRFALLDYKERLVKGIESIDFYDLLTGNGLITCYCYMKKDCFYRFEIADQIQMVLDFRKKFDNFATMKQFTLDEVEKFANTFNLTDKPYDYSNDNLSGLLMTNIASYIIFLAAEDKITAHLEPKCIKELIRIEKEMPKWILKGHNIKEFLWYHSTQLPYGDMIPDPLEEMYTLYDCERYEFPDEPDEEGDDEVGYHGFEPLEEEERELLGKDNEDDDSDDSDIDMDDLIEA